MNEARDQVLMPLRWADADAYGHVHHAMFLTLIEHARIEWLLRVLGSCASIFDHATVHLSIDYRAELLVEHGSVVCSFGVADVGRTSIELRETMATPDGQVVAELGTVIVAWNPKAHSTRPLTDAEREALLSLEG